MTRAMARGIPKSDRKDAIFLGKLSLAGGDVFPKSYLGPLQVRRLKPGHIYLNNRSKALLFQQMAPSCPEDTDSTDQVAIS
jgi:hypothetical protein